MKTAEDILRAKKRELITTPPTTTVLEALTRMRENRIGAILIEENGDIVGIWTERDLMANVIQPGFDATTVTVGERMSADLQSSRWSDSVYKLMDKFLGLRLRHLLIEKGGKYIGLLSSGDVMRAALREKNRELAALNATAGWDYYEEWKHTE